MTDAPQEHQDGGTSTPASDETDEELEEDERTADPDLGTQDASAAPLQPENPVDPDGSEGTT